MPKTNNIAEGWRTIVLGITGKGKSYFVKNEILPFIAGQGKPVIMFDRKGDYMSGLDMPKEIVKKATYHFSFKDFVKKEIVKTKGKLKNTVHIIRSVDFSDYNFGLSYIENFMRPEKEIPVSVILEEAHDIFHSDEMREARRPAERLISMGRASGIDILFISQSYYDVPKKIRRQFEGIVSFCQNEPSDLKELSKKFSDAEKVKDLDRGEFQVLGNLPNSWNFI